MPIHINLLAEAQVAEDLRRRDPVKRAIYAGSFLVVLALAWWSSLLLEVIIKKSELNQIQSRIQARTNEWQVILDNEKKISDAQEKLAALQKLNNARFLQGNFLNALQKLNYEGVQLASVKVKQTYFADSVAHDETSQAHTASARQATATEKIVLSIDARDVSVSPGDQVNKFKESLAGQDYFKNVLSKTNGVQLASLSSPQTSSDGKAFELFTLDCSLPQKTR
jgi:hypothetical protein